MNVEAIPPENSIEKYGKQLNPILVTNFLKLLRGQTLDAKEQVDLLEEFACLNRRPKQLKALSPESTWHIDYVAQWCRHAKLLKLLKPHILLRMTESIIANVQEATSESIVILLDSFASIIDVPDCVKALSNELDKRALTPSHASLALSAFARFGDATYSNMSCPSIRRFCDFLLQEDTAEMVHSLSSRELAQAAWALEHCGYLWKDVSHKVAERASALFPDKCSVQELSMVLSYLSKSPLDSTSVLPVFSLASVGFQRHIASTNADMMSDIVESFARRGFADESMARRLMAELPRTYSNPNSSGNALQSMLESLKTLGLQSQALEDYAPAMLAERSVF